MSAQPLVLMMAGGTGGHVYPALAVAEELISRGFRVEWMGTDRGPGSPGGPCRGDHAPLSQCARCPRQGPVAQALGPGLPGARLTAGPVAGAATLSPLRGGHGGYAAGPGGVAAWLLRKPLLIHEQNAVAGTTNRMLAPLAKRVLTGFPTDFKKAVDSSVVGNPLRAALLEAGASAADIAAEPPIKLLVLGGSLGAKPINDMLPEALRHLLAARGNGALQIRHQTGEAHARDVADAYGDLADGTAEILPYIEDMAGAYAWADLVLCRAGALTVSELAVMGRPAILVPLPHAIDDHQSANARYLSEAGAGLLVPQAELDAARLAALLGELMDDRQRLEGMARAARERAMPAATHTVSDCCEELAHGQ